MVSIDKDAGVVKLDDGTSVRGDIIIGADGVHSVTRRQFFSAHEPFGSGKSAFRFLIPRQAVLDDPKTRPYAETDGELVMIYHSDRRMVMYPTSDNSILNFVCIHPEAETASTATGNWNNNATKSLLLEVYKDFSDDFKAILAKSSEESLKIWKLLDMVRLFDDSWVHSLTESSQCSNRGQMVKLHLWETLLIPSFRIRAKVVPSQSRTQLLSGLSWSLACSLAKLKSV